MLNYDDMLDNTPSEEQDNPLSKEAYVAKKQTERETVFALSDNTALEVVGGGEVFGQYLDVQSRFSRYSAVNVLLILAQSPQATRLADFNHWKTLGCFVKPGQSAISILEPHKYTKEDGSIGTGYNIKKVFDISQVNGQKVKAPTPSNYTERQLLSALISKAPMKITGVDELPDNLGAMTNPTTGGISVLKGMKFADTFKSLAQELGYYEADADRDKIPVNPSFIGYCAAYVLCKKHGVDTQTFDFAKAPDVFHNLTPQGIKTQLSIIRDAVDSISERMAKHLEAVQKTAKAQESR